MQFSNFYSEFKLLADNTGFEYTYTLSDDGDLLEKQTYLNGTLVEELINVYNSDGELETSTRKNVNGTWETVYEYEEGCIVYSRTMGIDGDAASAAYQEIKEYYYSYVNDAGKTVGRDPE